MRSSSMKIRLAAVVAAIVAISAVVTAIATAGPEGRDGAGVTSATKPPGNIVETAVAAGQFKTLASLLQQAGLAETVATGGPFTVFAPTDAAFAKVPKKTLAALGNDKEQLKAVLLYHVANRKLRASRVVKRTSIKTLNGESVRVKVRKRSVRVNNAKIVKANVGASNGVIHVINRVLLPPKG